MNVLKSLPVWLCFIPVAILNGGLREYVLVEAIGEEWALPVSGIILSVCIFLITWMLLPRMIKAFTSKDGWLIGVGWALLTIAFEFAAGPNRDEEMQISLKRNRYERRNNSIPEGKYHWQEFVYG